MEYKTNVNYRKEKLKQLLNVVTHYEKDIVNALYNDFKKPEFEAVITETSYVITDLKNTIKSIEKWAKPKKVLPSLLNFPSSDYIISEPYGTVLIIAPWNYPFQLALCPLVAAVASGNKIVLKPSELTPNTSSVIAKIIAEVFDKNHVEVIEGGIEVSQQLLSKRWDYIFFTGSVPVGKIVAKAAAEFMTPITLELGGKNPCIVDQDCNIQLTAKRIVWGKFINAGQTCIAPDYLLVHKNVKTKIIEALKSEIILAYGTNPQISPDFPRIVNDKNWNRLIQFLDNETILFGGQTKKSEKYIAPTLLDNSKLTSLAMQDEIFGPILPILSYESEKEIDTIILNYEKPLAFYVFSNDIKWAKQMVKRYSFGGVVSMTLSFIFRIIDCLLEELEIVELALITEFQV
jgi:aldehyde dehydrogenase (NAD+)